MSTLLVEVVRIGAIEKHPNADTLSMTTVKGWNCIIKTGQFATGDLALYVPIDSVLPDWMVEGYELEYLKNGARVRTVKLRGVLSQGLLLTTAVAALYLKGKREVFSGFREGDNVGEKLGIKKWEPEAPAYQNGGASRPSTKHRPNPHFSRYCDPENIKNYPTVFKPGDPVVITEKIHGTNFRAGMVKRHWAGGFWGAVKRFFLGWRLGEWEFVVGSRNVQLVGDNPQFYEGNVYWDIAKRYNLAELIPPGYTLYGEIYGDKIQDLTYGLTGGKTDVVFFDLKRGEEYVPWSEFVDFCTARNLPVVPVLFTGPYSEGLMVEHTPGKSVLTPSQIREGCVIKTSDEVNDVRIGRKILKSVSEAYLLRKDGTEFH